MSSKGRGEVDHVPVRARHDASLREGRARSVRAERDLGDGVRGERPAHVYSTVALPAYGYDWLNFVTVTVLTVSAMTPIAIAATRNVTISFPISFAFLCLSEKVYPISPPVTSWNL